MHLLYVDESGSAADASQRYFVLAGVAVFERTTHWIELELDKIAMKVDPVAPHELELHGAPMRSGNKVWRQYPLVERENMIKQALEVGVLRQTEGVRLFACVVEKSAISGKDPVEFCFEQLARRFDLFLQRRYTKYNDAQRGIMLFDESSTEKRLQTLAREFKHNGHAYGKTRNYAEVPVFLDSKATRLIQLADLVAYSVFRHFERADSQYWDLIKDRFDTEGGVQHGFVLCDANNPLPLPAPRSLTDVKPRPKSKLSSREQTQTAMSEAFSLAKQKSSG